MREMIQKSKLAAPLRMPWDDPHLAAVLGKLAPWVSGRDYLLTRTNAGPFWPQRGALKDGVYHAAASNLIRPP